MNDSEKSECIKNLLKQLTDDEIKMLITFLEKIKKDSDVDNH